MPLDLATVPIRLALKRTRVERRRLAAAFTYDLSATNGLVIHRVASKVSKEAWDDLERFIRFCQSCTRVPLKVTVKLRPGGACNDAEAARDPIVELRNGN